MHNYTMIITLFVFRFKTTQTTTSHVYFGILVLILYCKFKNKLRNMWPVNHLCHSIVCMYSSDTLTSWSKEGIVTEVMVNSTAVKCLSSHLSSFAVIAEDPAIEVPIVSANITNITSVIAIATSASSTTDTTATAITDIISTSTSEIIATITSDLITTKTSDTTATDNIVTMISNIIATRTSDVTATRASDVIATTATRTNVTTTTDIPPTPVTTSTTTTESTGTTDVPTSMNLLTCIVV